MENFLSQFHFRKDMALFVGIERECFLTDSSGNIVPRAPEALVRLADRERFGYELSACQLEDRIGPVMIQNVQQSLLRNDQEIGAVMEQLGLSRTHIEVAPENMPLDVYPDPTGRYQEITKNMPLDIRLAACRVIGTHVHIGMPDQSTALRVYNKVIQSLDSLCTLGDGSYGERLRIYAMMAPDFRPQPYDSWGDFYAEAVRKNFVSDPRKCWHLIRISAHGTIEFRMFGATHDIDKIVGWANRCWELCSQALRNLS